MPHVEQGFHAAPAREPTSSRARQFKCSVDIVCIAAILKFVDEEEPLTGTGHGIICISLQSMGVISLHLRHRSGSSASEL